MSDRVFSVLAFKVVGLCFAIWGVIRMTGSLFWVFDPARRPDTLTVIALLVPGFLGLVAGGWTWRSANSLAARAIGPGDGDPTRRIAELPLGLLIVALSTLGLYLLVEGLAGVAKGVTLLYLSREGAPRSMEFVEKEIWQARLWDGFAKADVAAAATRALMGAGLLLGPARLASAFARLRKEFGSSLMEEQPADKSITQEKDGGA